MRFALPIALATAGAACSPNSAPSPIQRIEKEIQLPAGAETLDKYARYYARLPDGKVRAIYIIPYDLEKASKFNDLPASKSRWVPDYRNLPSIRDGGCTVIEFVFDPKADNIEGLACNGEA